MEKQFDPKVEFYKKSIEFLYKQAPAIVISVLACIAMGFVVKNLWEKSEERFMEIKQELVETRAHLRMCEEKREELATKVAALTIEVDFLKTRR